MLADSGAAGLVAACPVQAPLHWMVRLGAVALAAVGWAVSVPALHAFAQPAGFPDLSGFATVSPDGFFTQSGAGTARRVSFSTPYDIVCSFYGGEQPAPGASQGITCDGDMPGLLDVPVTGGGRAGPGDCVLGGVRPSETGYRLVRTAYGDCDDRRPRLPAGGKLLGVGQKVSYQSVTCAVGADRLVACLDTTSGEHGFVLHPASSRAF